MLRQPDHQPYDIYEEFPKIWRLPIQLGATLIVAALVVVGIFSIIGDAKSQELVVGRNQQSLVVICREDYDVEALLFAMEQGNFEARWAYLTEHRRCAKYFTTYKILNPVSTYYSYTIFMLLYPRGIGYSFTDYDVVAENFRY